MYRFLYPAALIPEKEDGGYVVRFPDFPETITQGDTVSDALKEAEDCLEEAIANRIVMGLDIPMPSQIQKHNAKSDTANERYYDILLTAQMAAKAALYIAMQEAGITKSELANRIQCDEKEVRRLLNPRHPSKLPRIEAALAAIGKRLVVDLQVAV